MNAAALLAEVEPLRQREPGTALARLEAGFASASRGADPATRGTLWRTRGHVLRSLRRMREAAAAYQRAGRCYRAAGDAREEGRCAIGLFDAYLHLGRYPEAQRTLRRGRRLLAKAGDRLTLARLLNSEGNLWHRLDLPRRALTAYQGARRGLVRSGDARGAAMVGLNVANCFSLLGRCDEARGYYREAREAQLAAGAHNEALSADYNLAYLDFLEHRDELALTQLADVRDEAARRGYPSLAALARLDRAEILLRLGAHDDALVEAPAAVEACAALELGYESAKAELFAALARFRTGRRQEARDGIDRALAAFDAEGNAVWTGEALVGLATLWRAEGHPRAATALLAAARARFRTAGDREREGCAATLEARARLDAGDRRGARRVLGTVTDPTRRARRSPRLEHLWLAARAALAAAEGDERRARALLRRAAAASERLAARILDEEWRATFWGEWGWPHRELAVLELRAGRVAAALEALEAGRGRALVGAAIARGGRGDVLPASVRRWAAGRQARSRTRDARTDGPVLRTEERMPRALERRAAGVVRVAALQAALPARALLLDWFEHEGTLGAFRVERDALAARAALATEARVNALASSVLFALRSAAFLPPAERRADPALAGALTELASWVLWPMLGPRSPKRLLLAPVGALARLPWAALPLADDHVLCEQVATVVAPGLRLALTPRSGLAAAAPPLVIAADSGDLAAVEREAEAVTRWFPNARVLHGRDATAERVLALAPDAEWIHFAGHGGWRADAPSASGLRLADRWLLAGELAERPLAARFVTLSACHTARALVRPGEEWFGLARAFLLAGAGAVAAAQWDVEDEATATLMDAVYQRLASGLALPDALALAQATRRAAGAHPLDWAGFVILGGPTAWAAPAGLPSRTTTSPRNEFHSPDRSAPRAPAAG